MQLRAGTMSFPVKFSTSMCECARVRVFVVNFFFTFTSVLVDDVLDNFYWRLIIKFIKFNQTNVITITTTTIDRKI